MPVRLVFRLTALGIGSAGLIFWLAGGMHIGWSKTTETMTKIDEVTGLEYPVTENRYVFGLELLSATVVLTAGLFGVSVAFGGSSRPDVKTVGGTKTISS